MPRNVLGLSPDLRKVWIYPPTPDDPEGTWAMCRLRLTWEERKRLALSVYRQTDQSTLAALQQGGGMSGFDLMTPSFLKVASYVDSWNAAGPDGQPLPWPDSLEDRVELVKALDEEAGNRLEQAINSLAEAEAQAEPETAGTEDGAPNPSKTPGSSRRSKRRS